MTKKRIRLFLYLAIACFAGIIAIFVFDGYVGTYDTVYVTTGEYEQEIGTDFWQNQQPKYAYPYNIGVRWGDSVYFRYEIDNRTSSAYIATVEASLWKSNEELFVLFNQDIEISGFDKKTVEWTVETGDVEETGLGAGEYTVKIMRGEVELGRGIVLGFYSPADAVKPPPPVR